MSAPSDASTPRTVELDHQERERLAVGNLLPEKRILQVPAVPRVEGTPLALPLYRFPGEGPPVLLIHGASAWSASFTAPPGASLVQRLRAANPDVDVWMLDWRGGRNVVFRQASKQPARAFTWDAAATIDIPTALQTIQQVRGDEVRPAVLGHCVGGGILAMAIGAMDPTTPHFPSRVVLSTLGLFHVQPWDGLLRASDFILERVAAEHPDTAFIHPHADRHRWPDPLREAARQWPAKLLPPTGPDHDIFRNLAFMFGRIAIWDRLHPAMRSDAAMLQQFGAMHMTAYLQAGQMVRRGFAAPMDSPERVAPGRRSRLDERYVHDAREHWRPSALESVTLITGDENDLWHRDAIDRMGEWLAQIRGPEGFDKHVLPGWAHQDLLWGCPDEGDDDPIRHYVRGVLGPEADPL